MSPRLRIQSVAERTGIPAHTLRAWERRYGVPRPSRSRSGYRLYAEADIARIERMQALIEEGHAPAEAAQLVDTPAPTPTVGPSLTTAATWQTAQARILRAVEGFDPNTLRAAVRSVLYLGAPDEVGREVLAPVLERIGERWRKGELTVAAEHLASHAIGDALAETLSWNNPAGPRVLLACFAEETHVLPLYLVALTMQRHGFGAELLGARTPPSAIAKARAELSPHFIGLSVTTPPADPAGLVAAYGEACGEVPWMVGGAAAAELAPLVEAAGGTVVIGPFEDLPAPLGRGP